MAKLANIVIVQAWCSECSLFTLHVHRQDGELDCLPCRAKGNCTLVGKELPEPYGSTSLVHVHKTAR